MWEVIPFAVRVQASVLAKTLQNLVWAASFLTWGISQCFFSLSVLLLLLLCLLFLTKALEKYNTSSVGDLE